MTTIQSHPLFSKILGSCLGEAIGDALGYPVEFSGQTPDARSVFGLVPSRTDFDGRKVAFYSDDTQMMRAVAEGLITGGANFELATAAVAKEFVRWSKGPDGGHRAPGGTCMRGCANLADGVPPLMAGDFSERGGGCGAVMRSAPYGWAFRNRADCAIWAAKHAGMTHGFRIGQASSAALAVAVATAMRADATPEAVAFNAIKTARFFDEMTARMIAEASYYAASRVVSDTQVLDQFRGWAGHEAIAASIYCFLRWPNNFDQAVLLAVNSPGDSDSLGAITGAISGAYLGADAIPESWINDIEKRDQLIDLAVRFSKRFLSEPVTISSEEESKKDVSA